MEFSRLKNSWYPLSAFSEARGVEPEYLQSVKYELDKHVYYFGENFKNPTSCYNVDQESNIQDLLSQSNSLLQLIFSHQDWQNNNLYADLSPTIVCNAYFSWNQRISNLGFKVVAPIWTSPSENREIEIMISYLCQLVTRLFSTRFQVFFNKQFIEIVNATRIILEKYYSHPAFVAYVMPYNLPFFEYSANQIFRSQGKLTFMAIHGLSHGYSEFNAKELCEFNHEKYFTDYYLVWGDAIADQFPKHGIDRSKVFVTGHPDYIDTSNINSVRFDFDNVLVCTRAIAGAPAMNLPVFQNVMNLVDYLYRVQIVLRKLGITKARLRPHPSESHDWYRRYIDNSFYELDDQPLRESLISSSLVIGAASTVFIEAVLQGVNYLIFDPKEEYDPCGYMPYDQPFDGSNPLVPVAKSGEELFQILKEKRRIDIECLKTFIKSPFSCESILEMVLKNYNQILTASSRSG